MRHADFRGNARQARFSHALSSASPPPCRVHRTRHFCTYAGFSSRNTRCRIAASRRFFQTGEWHARMPAHRRAQGNQIGPAGARRTAGKKTKSQRKVLMHGAKVRKSQTESPTRTSAASARAASSRKPDDSSVWQCKRCSAKKTLPARQPRPNKLHQRRGEERRMLKAVRW